MEEKEHSQVVEKTLNMRLLLEDLSLSIKLTISSFSQWVCSAEIN